MNSKCEDILTELRIDIYRVESYFKDKKNKEEAVESLQEIIKNAEKLLKEIKS